METQNSNPGPVGEHRQTPHMRDHSGNQPPRPTGSERVTRDMSHIKGWGVDRDHKDRPAHPMERTPPRLENVHWETPEDQPLNMTVFHSTERSGVTPLFGTSTPPRGLSGAMRAKAYGWSESDLRRWLTLLVADRVDVFEGLFDDLRRGRLPNVFAEMGIRAELKHNPAGLAKKAVAGMAVVGVAYFLLRRRSR